MERAGERAEALSQDRPASNRRLQLATATAAHLHRFGNEFYAISDWAEGYGRSGACSGSANSRQVPAVCHARTLTGRTARDASEIRRQGDDVRTDRSKSRRTKERELEALYADIDGMFRLAPAGTAGTPQTGGSTWYWHRLPQRGRLASEGHEPSGNPGGPGGLRGGVRERASGCGVAIRRGGALPADGGTRGTHSAAVATKCGPLTERYPSPVASGECEGLDLPSMLTRRSVVARDSVVPTRRGTGAYAICSSWGSRP